MHLANHFSRRTHSYLALYYLVCTSHATTFLPCQAHSKYLTNLPLYFWTVTLLRNMLSNTARQFHMQLKSCFVDLLEPS